VPNPGDGELVGHRSRDDELGRGCRKRRWFRVGTARISPSFGNPSEKITESVLFGSRPRVSETATDAVMRGMLQFIWMELDHVTADF